MTKCQKKKKKKMLSSNLLYVAARNQDFIILWHFALNSLNINSSVLLFNSHYQHKINEIVNNVLLTGDKFIPKMHLES